MKRIFILSIIFSSFITISFSQDKDENIERVKAQKVAFFTEKMNLNCETSQQFWPIYNDFFDKKSNLYSQIRTLRHDLNNKMDQLTDDQKNKALNLILKLKVEGAELEQTYHKRFAKILTTNQLILLYQAEHEFRKKMIDHLHSQSSQNK